MKRQWMEWQRIRRWKEELRETILERDNYTCQSCGYSPNLVVIGKRMKLHMHHIDRNRKNNAHSNLITLCASCHSKVHYRLRNAQEK